MIKSMTGFASVTREDERATVSVTIRALNHRHLDLQLRTPQSMNALEADIRGLVAKAVARGRVELSVSVQVRQALGVEVEFNEDFGRALEAALDKARARGLVQGALTPGDLLRLPQALTIRERQAGDDDEAGKAALEALGTLARGAVEQALRELDTMRAHEGDHVRADLDTRRSLVADLVERIATAADDGRAAIEARIGERVRQLRTELQADETAVAQEIVRMAARSDISEEVTRFRAHVSHWVALADGAEPCGRKLDFLLQEMNREVNTMGSKADGLKVSELIIAAKAELEKMREQVQNVE
jgi:uncharacterized protein (TIGR00255 family)